MRKPLGIPEQRMNLVTLKVEDPPDRSTSRVKFRALLKITVNTLTQPRTNWKDRQDKLKEKSTKSPEQSSSSQHIDKSPYITRDELITAINEALTSRQPSYRGSVQKNKSPITCYRCGEQGHYANSCVSERPLKDNQRSNPLNPRASEFKQTLN